jgi:hypothetical protein
MTMVSAALLLAAAAGCFGNAFVAPPVNLGGSRQVVAGTPGQVSAILEAGLGEAGIAVLVKRQGGEVRLVGQTDSGKAFCLYVKRVQAAKGQKTVVSVHWDGQPDEHIWNTVVDLLTEYAPDAERSKDSQR